jgi:hypothetical protein
MVYPLNFIVEQGRQWRKFFGFARKKLYKKRQSLDLPLFWGALNVKCQVVEGVKQPAVNEE